METAVRTPLTVFNLPQHLVVPIFQRPYVWDEEKQWLPLWQDVRRLADHRLSFPGSTPTHFLGAVVLQARTNQAGTLQPRDIIDGQQRLTTLQLLLDATAAVLEEREFERHAGQIESLTHNSLNFVTHDEDVLKVRHTNRDRAAYDEVMSADPPIDYDRLLNASSLIARAHRFFSEQVSAWLAEGEAGTIDDRAPVLTEVITTALQLVVIDLKADEDSQEIFETLNARGTPLTAADLIKNFVFQRLSAEGVDTRRAYTEQWPFEASFWEKELSVGRYPVSRGSLFLNQWLISRVGEEIGPRSTFNRFKYYVENKSQQKMVDLLGVINEQAALYRTWTERAESPHGELTRTELCVYRMRSADTEVLKPILIWLHEPEGNHGQETIDRVVGATESWIMRRALLRISSGDVGRIAADLIASHRAVPDDELPNQIAAFLSRQVSASTYWPGDTEIREAMVKELAYRRFRRGRLRMFLEAAEDHYRGFTGSKPPRAEARVPRVGFPIEHLLPQRWRDTWPVEDLAEEIDREAHVHRLGNLTLVTASLNSAVSNGPWLGANGKLAKLHAHDVLLMNRRIRDASEEGWTEELIDERSIELVDALLATWPVPEGHTGMIESPGTTRDSTWVTLRDLIVAGLLEPGTRLRARPTQWSAYHAEVLLTGDLLLDGIEFSSSSAAAHHLRKGAANGWHFWLLPDGRRLKDLRAEYLAQRP